MRRHLTTLIATAASAAAVLIPAASAHAARHMEVALQDDRVFLNRSWFDRDMAFERAKPAGGLIVLPDSFTTGHRDLIIALVARYRVPAVYYERAFADSGGLIAYSPDYGEHVRGAAASFVNRGSSNTKACRYWFLL